MYYPETKEEVSFGKDNRLCEVIVFQDHNTGELLWNYSDSFTTSERALFLGIGAGLLDETGMWVRIEEIYYANEYNDEPLLQVGEFASKYLQKEIVLLNESIKKEDDYE